MTATADACAAAGVRANLAYVASDLARFVLSYKDSRIDPALLEEHPVTVGNARLLDPAPSLDREGFLLADWPSGVVRTRRDALIAANASAYAEAPRINVDYAMELVPLIKRLSGARDVLPQDGTTQVRFSNRAALRSWMMTSAFAHLDFTADQIETLVERSLQVAGRPIAPYSRQVLIQTWRVITDPPQDMPLTICDGRSVPPEDMIPMEFHGPPGSLDPLVRARVCRFSPQHRWYYFPMMTQSEVLVFKGYDSACPDAMNAMHSSFDDLTVPDAVPRGSVECRFVALYD